VIDCVVAPVDQRLPVADEEVRVMVAPPQREVGPLMMGVAGSGLTLTTVAAEVAWQPLALVTVTLYEPDAETVMDCVVAPVDQRFPVVEEEVSVVLPPAQNAVVPLMAGVAGSAFAVTANGAEVAWQPPALVAVTLYEPAAETAIDCVVAPVDQRFPVAEEEVSVIEVPGQNEAGPVMVGVAGAAFAVTATAADVALQPLALVTVTL
jgi:hypothetical protein